MRRSLAFLAVAGLLAACSSSDGSETTAGTRVGTSAVPETSEAEPAVETTAAPDETSVPAVDETLDVEVPDEVAPTPSTPEGERYPTEFPVDVDADLVVSEEGSPATGEVLELSGAVVTTAGVRIEGATVEVWQADAEGAHRGFGDADPDFQGFGFTTTNANGAYRFRTVVPGPSDEGPPHVNVKVRVDGREVLNTRLLLAGEGVGAPAGDEPGIVVELSAGSEGLTAEAVLVVDTEGGG